MDAAGRRAAPLCPPSSGLTKRLRHTDDPLDASGACGAALVSSMCDANPTAALWHPELHRPFPPVPSTSFAAYACQEASAGPVDPARMTPAQRRQLRAAFRAQRGHVRFGRGRTTAAIRDVPVLVAADPLRWTASEEEHDCGHIGGDYVDDSGGDAPYDRKDEINPGSRCFANFPQQSHHECMSTLDNVTTATDLVLSVFSPACPDVCALEAPCNSPADIVPHTPPATKLQRAQHQPRHRQGLIDKKQARIIRNREVALKARQAAKEKLAQLESDNDALNSNASCLESENATLRSRIQALRHGVFGDRGPPNYP
jgi:hypothetical protein